jgi:hypothetical protein
MEIEHGHSKSEDDHNEEIKQSGNINAMLEESKTSQQLPMDD